MPSVRREFNTSGVIVSYPTREETHEINDAEYRLIKDLGTANYVGVIKFMRGRYGLSLYSAKQIVDTILGEDALT